ncbi:unnamed protein product [Closterium sp. NIES-53]
MYAVTDSAEGDCYLCVPPHPGIEAAALGASEAAAPGVGESSLSGTAPTKALHTFTLVSGASRSFFCDSTTLTPLSQRVAVSLADPSGGPVLAHSSTVLPCPTAPSGLLSGLHLPSFSTNLVSGADLQDAWVDQFTPGGQRMTHCTCSRTGRHLATFTRRPGSSLYTLTTASGRVATSGQVFGATSRSSPASAPCSCRPLSHETLLWHHRLGHPSLPRLRGMASRTLFSGLPQSIPPLPPGPAPTCVPCVEGRQRAAPHSSEFPPIEAPLQTLHMDVWGPARVRGQGHERYFLLVVDDYSRYTTVFPLRRKDRGGEFSSDLLRAFCRAEGICQTFTLPASPQQNGIAGRRIGMVMDVARTSMIHAAAPHFLWPFAVQYATHQIKLQPRVSLPETTPILRWTGKVGDASVFRVLGSRAIVRDASADKLSSRAVPCVFLGFPPDAHGWQFYHPTSRRVLSSQDVTFDESVSYYRLFPYRTAPLPPPPPPPLFLTPGAPPVDPLPPQGLAPSGVSEVDPVEPVEVAVDSGAARGAEPAGARPGGAEPGVAESEGAEPGGAEPECVEPGGGEPGGAESGGAEPRGAEPGGAESGGVPSRREPLSPQQLHEWYARRCRRATGATGPTAGDASRAGAARGAAGAAATGGASGVAGGTAGAGVAGAAGPGGAGVGGTGAVGGPAGVGAAGGAGAAGPVGARTGGTGAAGAGGAAGVGAVGAGAVTSGGAAGAGAVGGIGVGGAVGVVAGDPGGEGTGAVSAVFGAVARLRSYYLQPASPLPGPSPYSGPTRGLTERREPDSRPASPKSRLVSPESSPESPVRPIRTGLRVPRQRPPPVPGTHSITLRPSTAPQRVPLPSPLASSLPALAVLESDSLHTASPTVTRLLGTVVTDPSFESTAASALVAELVDFAAHCRLDYAASLVAESESASVYPPSVGGECALGTDVLEDRLEEFECFAAAVPHLVSMLLAPEGDPDAPDIPTPRSYAEAIEGPYSSQWQAAMDAEMASWKSTGTYVNEVPSPGANIVTGMWIFRVKRPPGSPPVFKARYVARGFSQRQGVDFFQTFSPTLKMTTLRGSLHEEIWLRRPSGFTGPFPPGTQTTLAALGFAPSTSDPSLFLCADTTLPLFYVLVYVDNLVFATADTEALAHSPWCSTSGMGLVFGGRARVVLTVQADASWVDDLATQRSSQGYTFSLGSDSVSWRSTRSSSGPRSPPVLYVDNKAMLALCQEHRLEHRTKHIALRYFLARDLQQCGQLRLAYVASRANTADVFTEALQPCDHQRFCSRPCTYCASLA